MIFKDICANFDCYRAEWEDEWGRISLHFHTFHDQTNCLEIRQLELKLKILGPMKLIEPRGESLPCDF